MMVSNLLKNNILREFFEDINVNFPEKPKLISGISIYAMPNGLGIQFRGGQEKLILKGKNSLIIWSFLEEKLVGNFNLDIIFSDAKKCNIDVFEVATFIKLLHCNHLLEPKNKNINNDYNLDIFVQKQKQYYDRVIGITGHNDDSFQVIDKLRNTKVLIIADDYLVPIICYNLYLAGFIDLGIFYFKEDIKSFDLNYVEGLNIMTEKNVTKLENSELRDLLASKIDDYKYVFTAINNPSIHFLHEISRFCSSKNIPVLNISFNENVYEVGPFFFPNTYTACSTCYSLRKQSFETNPEYNFLYQNNLKINKVNSNIEIKGFDIQGFCSVLNFAILDFKHVISNLSKSNFVNKILHLNTINLEMKNTEIIPVLGCPTCSSKN